jgi:hypothetical protein
VKRFISVLSGLLVLPAFAEVTPAYHNDMIEYSDSAIDVENNDSKTAGQRPVINRSTSVSRVISSGNNASTRTNTSSRAVASSQRTATNEAPRGTVARTAKTQNVATRSANTTTDAKVTSRTAQTQKPVASRIGVTGKAVLSGNSVVLTGTGQSSRIGITNRRSSTRVASVSATNNTPVLTQEEVTATTDNMTAIAELTDYCKMQYAACMDNYCNVLDDNQGRCSCSKNVKNYEKTEAALAQVTESFQNVVQQIRYIGLSKDQVESLFTETEAELTMKSTSDSSRLKNSLDSIKKKILDVSTPSASSTAITNGLSLDMNGLLTADFTAGFDLNSFLNMNNNSADSVSNQRGDQLYKTASSRCKAAVLNSCAAQGIDTSVITNSYDLEIDKQCVLYERSLVDANAEMKQNVTNATTILQQARLLLAQNKNSYDLRGCVAAIDSCMQDDYVCGNDYELCLDPTGKYISDSEIIKGSTPGVSGGQVRTKPTSCAMEDADVYNPSCLATYFSGGMFYSYTTWDYTCSDTAAGASSGTGVFRHNCNAWSIGPNENLGGYIDYHLSQWKSNYKSLKDTTVSDYVAMYLLQKLGYIDDNDKVHGMCASILKQCQDYTYSGTSSKKSKKKYVADNEVIRQYLATVLPKIKVQQDAVIADYAESCRTDVQSCLSTNGYEEDNTTSTASKTAINACAGEITTCMSVGGYQITEGATLTLRAMSDWVDSMLKSCPEGMYLKENEDGSVDCVTCQSVHVLVNSGYTMYDDGVPNENQPYNQAAFYSSWPSNDRPTSVTLVSAGGHVSSCSCPDGYRNYPLHVIKNNGNNWTAIFGTTTYEEGSILCIDEQVRCDHTYSGGACSLVQ